MISFLVSSQQRKKKKKKNGGKNLVLKSLVHSLVDKVFKPLPMQEAYSIYWYGIHKS